MLVQNQEHQKQRLRELRLVRNPPHPHNIGSSSTNHRAMSAAASSTAQFSGEVVPPPTFSIEDQDLGKGRNPRVHVKIPVLTPEQLSAFETKQIERCVELGVVRNPDYDPSVTYETLLKDRIPNLDTLQECVRNLGVFESFCH